MARVTPYWSHGLAFCPVCHESLDSEDIEWGDCASCGGEGRDEPDFDIEADEPHEQEAGRE